MNIAEYDMKFIPEMKYLCAKNCAYQVLDYLGIENPLDYIYIGFTPYICAFQNDFFPSGKVLSISDKTSIVSSGSGINFAEVFDLNLSQRNYGLYPIVLVDTYYLPYRQEYMKHHGAHAIIFNGVKGEDVDIVDWYDPAFFKGTIKFQCYADARDSSFSDSSNPFTLRAVKNRWFCIEPDKITTHNRKLIINENLSSLKISRKSDNPFEKTGVDALLLLYEMSGQAYNSQHDQQKVMKRIHDALFPFLCTSKLMKRYIYDLHKSDGQELLVRLDSIVQLLELINYFSLRCSIVYNKKHDEKVNNALSNLIETVAALQDSSFLKDMNNMEDI